MSKTENIAEKELVTDIQKKSLTSKSRRTYALIQTAILITLNAFSPSFAAPFYEQNDDSQTGTQVSPWADFQTLAKPASVIQEKLEKTANYAQRVLKAAGQGTSAKSSKRTNTNLSKDLPPTWTANIVELNVATDGEPEPPDIDMTTVMETYYDAKEQSEATQTKTEQFTGLGED